MLALARQHPSFAGVFFEPGTGRLVVASTSTDASDATSVRQTVLTAVGTELGHPQTAAGGELALNAVHRIFEYSFLELARHRARIRSHIFGIPGVQSLSVDEEHNRIKVGLLDPSARDRVEELAIDLAIPIQMLSFAQASPVHPMYGTSRSTPPRPRTSSGPTLRDVISVPDDKLRGGYMIQAERTSGTCTLGFTAVGPLMKGAETAPRYFVTNSHCSRRWFRLDSGYWNQPDNKRGPERDPPKHDYFPRGVGRESIDPRPRGCVIDGRSRSCRWSDASLVKTYFSDIANPPLPRLIALGEIGRTKERSNCSFCEASITIDTINPTISIVATRNSIIDNEELDKIGQRTGWIYGDVEDTCVNLPYTDVVIRCTAKIRFPIGGGDSGSPVFQYDSISGEARLVGIVWGGEEIDLSVDRARVGLISPFGQIKKDLGEFLNVCNYMPTCEGPT